MLNQLGYFNGVPADAVRIIFGKVPIYTRVLQIPRVCRDFKNFDLNPEYQRRYEELTFEDHTHLRKAIGKFSEEGFAAFILQIKDSVLLPLIIKVYLSSHYILLQDPIPIVNPITRVDRFDSFAQAYYKYKKSLKQLSKLQVTTAKLLEIKNQFEQPLNQRAQQWGIVMHLPNDNWIWNPPPHTRDIFLRYYHETQGHDRLAMKTYEAIVTYFTEKKVTSLLEKLSELGEQNQIDAQLALAMIYNGTSKLKNEQLAIKWFKRVAESGHVEAQFYLGELFFRANNYPEALRSFRCAAEQGHAPSQAFVGRIFQDGLGVPANPNEAVKWYCLSSEQNNDHGMNNLGWMYENGCGVEKDENETRRLYMRAAIQNNPYAYLNLACIYHSGVGVEKNPELAYRWCYRAAEQNLKSAQNWLGTMLRDGEGTPKNEEEAVNWFRKAANQNVPYSQYYLGQMLETGKGVAQNVQEAANWYRKAAEQGHANAQARLAEMYEEGIGVPKDEQEALKWYRAAAKQQCTIS